MIKYKSLHSQYPITKLSVQTTAWNSESVYILVKQNIFIILLVHKKIERKYKGNKQFSVMPILRQKRLLFFFNDSELLILLMVCIYLLAILSSDPLLILS